MKIQHFKTIAAMMLAGGMLVSCGKSGSDELTEDAVKDLGPVETVEFVSNSIGDGQAEAIWLMLPESYQDEIHSVIHLFAEEVDPDLYQQGADLLKKIVKVLEEKRDFILGSPMLAQAMTEANVEEGYDAVVELLSTIVNSEFGDLEAMKTLDLGEMLPDAGREILAKMQEAAVIAGDEDPFEVLSSGSYELVSEEGDTAVVRMTYDGETEENEMRKVDGKWLPVDMVVGFEDGMAETKTAIKEMDWEEGKMTAMTMISGMDSTLDELLAADSEEEFNNAMMQLMGGFMGGGAPPAGGPGSGATSGGSIGEEDDFGSGLPSPGSPGLPTPPAPPSVPGSEPE